MQGEQKLLVFFTYFRACHWISFLGSFSSCVMYEGELLAPSHCLIAALEISPTNTLPIKHPLLQLSSLDDSEVTETKATSNHVRTASLGQE